MDVKLSVKRTFVVNGKRYDSLDHLPEPIRKAAGHLAASKSIPAVGTKIVFNGREYAGLDTMPPDVRRLYCDALKAAGISIENPLQGAAPGVVATQPKAAKMVALALVALAGLFFTLKLIR